MGLVPAWYRIQKAAQYLGTTPWELEERKDWWKYVRQSEEAQATEAYVAEAQKPKES